MKTTQRVATQPDRCQHHEERTGINDVRMICPQGSLERHGIRRAGLPARFAQPKHLAILQCEQRKFTTTRMSFVTHACERSIHCTRHTKSPRLPTYANTAFALPAPSRVQSSS